MPAQAFDRASADSTYDITQTSADRSRVGRARSVRRVTTRRRGAVNLAHKVQHTHSTRHASIVAIGCLAAVAYVCGIYNAVH